MPTSCRQTYPSHMTSSPSFAASSTTNSTPTVISRVRMSISMTVPLSTVQSTSSTQLLQHSTLPPISVASRACIASGFGRIHPGGRKKFHVTTASLSKRTRSFQASAAYVITTSAGTLRQLQIDLITQDGRAQRALRLTLHVRSGGEHKRLI
jgi:hypothetical protein